MNEGAPLPCYISMCCAAAGQMYDNGRNSSAVHTANWKEVSVCRDRSDKLSDHTIYR